MKLIRPNDFTSLDTVEKLKTFLTKFAQEIQTAVNGYLTFHENISPTIVSASFSTANAEVSVPHPLSRVPQGYIVTSVSAAMIIYSGTTANTDSRIYLKSSAIGTASIWVF